MKKILLVVCTIISSMPNTCNLCWDYKIKDPRLIREDISHDPQCTCNCWQYAHTKGTNNFYRCGVCGHRMTPPDPLSKKGPHYKTYNDIEDAQENAINPPIFMQQPKRHPQLIQFPLTNLKK